MSQINSYVNEVLSYIDTDKSMKMRFKSDLTLQLNDAAESESIEEVLKKMGDPKDVAREFMDSINEGKGTHQGGVFTAGYKFGRYNTERIYEYKSKARLFGIPLVHIKLSRYGKPAVAKGIIAIGTVSVGVISIGAIPIGIISIGALSIGVLSFGAIALGLLLAVGGAAVGAFAIGGIAIGLAAIGGVAVGEIAIGGYARGTVAIGAEAVGKYSLIIQHTGPETKAAVENLIRSAFPELPEWIEKFFSSVKISNVSN
jgi:hypothetical protein